MSRLNSYLTEKNYFRLAILLWCLYVVLVCVIVWHQGHDHTVTPNYLIAASHWLHGNNLYNSKGVGFIYLPQSAVLFVPFAFIAKYSFAAAEIIWRILSLGLFAYAVLCFARLLDVNTVKKTFLIITVVSLLLAFSSARNGQFNIILSVLMLLAVCGIAKERWWLVVFYLILGFAFKPTMIVLLLLVFALYRPARWRLIIGMIIFVLLPFLTQDFHYVASQYVASVAMLHVAANLGMNMPIWAQFFGILSQVNISVPDTWQNVIRIICAILTLGCAWRAHKQYKINLAVIFLYTFAACYLMLFNPRTEHNDYVIMAPSLGIFLAWSFYVGRRYLSIFLTVLVVGIAFAGRYTFGSGYRHEYWSAPLLASLFVIIVLWFLYSSKAPRLALT